MRIRSDRALEGTAGLTIKVLGSSVVFTWETTQVRHEGFLSVEQARRLASLLLDAARHISGEAVSGRESEVMP